MNIEKYFKNQNQIEIKEDDINKLKGRSIYSNYQIGDIVLHLMIVELEDDSTINMSIRPITKRELNILNKDYKYLGLKTDTIPLFIKKTKIKDKKTIEEIKKHLFDFDSIQKD